MSFLFDSSSIFEALVEKRVKALHGGYTIDLAMYELGNTIWKRAFLLKDVSYEEVSQLISLVKKVLKQLKIVRIACHEKEVADTAFKLNITFYDASYVFAAKNKNFILVTEDEKLRSKIGNYVDTLSLKEI